jgi:hypothetical protein
MAIEHTSATLWTYRRICEGEFARVSRRVCDGFFNFTAAIPASEGAFVYTVSFAVLLRERRPVGWRGEWYVKYKVSPEGILDEEHWRDAKRTAIDVAFGDIAFPLPGDAPRSETPVLCSRMAARREETMHRWRPTETDLRALRTELSARGMPS